MDSETKEILRKIEGHLKALVLLKIRRFEDKYREKHKKDTVPPATSYGQYLYQYAYIDSEHLKEKESLLSESPPKGGKMHTGTKRVEQPLIKEAVKLWDKIHGKTDLPIWKKESDREYPPEFWKVVNDWIKERGTGAFDKKTDNELHELLKERIRSNPPHKP